MRHEKAVTDLSALSATGKVYEVPTETGSPLWVSVSASPDKKGKAKLTYICRTRINGKSVKKVIGKASEWTLTEAKRKARAIDEDARENGGLNHLATSPVVLATQGATQAETVEWAWHTYMDREAEHLVSVKEKRGHWLRIIQPAWGTRLLKSITRRDCVDMLEAELAAANARGDTGTSSNNLLKTIKRFFEWSLEQGFLDANPAGGVKKRVDEALHRRPSRALSERELVWLFRALDQHKGTRANGIELLLRSVCRLASILESRWEHVGDHGLLLPKTKNGSPFMVPLTDTMRPLLGEAGEGKVFPGNLTYKARLIEDLRRTMTVIARKDGFKGNFENEFNEDGTRNVGYWSAHDFRDTATMWFKNQRTAEGLPIYPAEVRKAMLNHRPKDVEAKHYNDDSQDPFWEFAARKHAGAAWNAYLDGVKAKALNGGDVAW